MEWAEGEDEAVSHHQGRTRRKRRLQTPRCDVIPSSRGICACPTFGGRRDVAVRQIPRSARNDSSVVTGGCFAQRRLLRRHEPLIGAALAGDQLARRPGFHQSALFEHDDPVGVGDARQSVGDHQRGSTLLQTLERLLNRRLVLRVDARQGFVEDQDGRVLQQRSSNCQALALAAREPHAALADQRVVSMRQVRDEAVRVGRAARPLQLAQGGVGRATRRFSATVP